jgi:hypothetical protein
MMRDARSQIWKVSNPRVLKGHGGYVEIQIPSVRMLKGEWRTNDSMK